MEQVLLVIHLLIAIALVAVVLLQRSEGGALGIGGGGGGGLVSARGAANALTRLTGWLAAGFFITSIALTLIARQAEDEASVLDTINDTPAVTTPSEGGELPALPGADAEPAVPQVPVTDQ